jgi:uncharacterized protein
MPAVRLNLAWPPGSWLLALVLAVLLGLPAAPAAAQSAAELPAMPPADHVIDGADLLSRAAASELRRDLDRFSEQGVQATWISVPRLDYGLSLSQLGQELLERWSASDPAQLLLLIDGQTSGTSIVASADLQDRLPPDLLASTARTTMAQPLREGGRFRQASLDASHRLAAVLAGEPDPGPPQSVATAVTTARVPSREDTASSNAFTWVAVLLVVGTVVPMLTWWVFSR